MIGPWKFGRPPSLVGASSVPELLEQGGSERLTSYLGGSTIAYNSPHPYIGPMLPIAERKFRELVERVPL